VHLGMYTVVWCRKFLWRQTESADSCWDKYYYCSVVFCTVLWLVLLFIMISNSLGARSEFSARFHCYFYLWLKSDWRVRLGYLHTYIHACVPWIHKCVVKTVGCRTSHKYTNVHIFSVKYYRHFTKNSIISLAVSPCILIHWILNTN